MSLRMLALDPHTRAGAGLLECARPLRGRPSMSTTRPNKSSTIKLARLAVESPEPGERAAAREALDRTDPESSALLGLLLVGAGPEVGETWVHVKPAPLGGRP